MMRDEFTNLFNEQYPAKGPLEAEIREEEEKIKRIKARMEAINTRDNVAMCHEED